ncbi:MAG: 50S ribosomal protein L19e [Candidatus Micrarchaeota archaeon]|nr:50S ribosomal protein L19e [Candidatus Micrarchaeota archaeon]
MAMATVKRIASELLGVGKSQIRFKPDSLQKIEEALTREDVRSLIKEGAVYALSPRGACRLRRKKKAGQLRKGRRSGTGTRKGSAGARMGNKKFWIARVRAQRKYLRILVSENRLPPKEARRMYWMIKGNAFRGVRALETFLHENKLLQEERKKASESNRHQVEK